MLTCELVLETHLIMIFQHFLCPQFHDFMLSQQFVFLLNFTFARLAI